MVVLFKLVEMKTIAIFFGLINALFFYKSHAQNLILNGSFEEGSKHWSNWQPPNLQAGTICEISNRAGTYGISSAMNGRYFAEVDYESNFSQKVSTSKGNKYILKFAITRRFDSNGDRFFKVVVDGREIFHTLVNTKTFGNTFQYRQVEMVAENEITNICFYILGTSGGGGTVGVMLDDISLVDVKSTVNPDLTIFHKGEKFILKNVLFEQRKSTLLSSSKVELDKLSTFLLKNPSLFIRLVGHTDNGGDEKKNFVLSVDRVKQVKIYLVSKGIQESRIACEGRGESQPIADNNDPAKKYLNRRVELEIIESPQMPLVDY